MDLRPYKLTPRQVEEAARLLNYQPFIISDDIQTGVAYSWLHVADPRVTPPMLFRRGDASWNQAASANAALRALYDGFIEQIAQRFPSCSLFDVACNNGYFPVKAELLGMRGCVGSDLNNGCSDTISLLNRIVGTRVRFVHAPYRPIRRRIGTWRKFDVVVASAILCHLPNPLDFLAALSRVARRAIFFWGDVATTEDMAIFYQKPHPALGDPMPFPYGFNDRTMFSRSLFDYAMRELGFREIIELDQQEGTLKLPGHVGLLAIR
jgi:SAM-dependent methyltransferase